MKFKLDFNIYSSKDRLEAIKSIPLNTLTPSELETVTNYVLYGKDEDGTSVVDRKEVQIKTKFNTYQKQKFVSLDEMMESPTFDEGEVFKDRPIYKNVKPSINKEKAQDIPGMKELWNTIDKYQRILDENEGKIPKTDETPTLNQRETYMLKHHLVEIRTHQYYLMDSYFPQIKMMKKNKGEFYRDPLLEQLTYNVFPRGVMQEENDPKFAEPRKYDSGSPAFSLDLGKIEELKQAGKPYFNFLDENHLYYLILKYREIRGSIEDEPHSPLWGLIWTIDFYIGRAKLSDQQRLIVEGKKAGLSNLEIQTKLKEDLGISHQVNYISTIWKKSIRLIIDAVEINYDEWLAKDYDKAWKKCSCCGNEKLKDTRMFCQKAKSSDGFTSRCKACDAMKRQEKKLQKIQLQPTP